MAMVEINSHFDFDVIKKLKVKEINREKSDEYNWRYIFKWMTYLNPL